MQNANISEPRPVLLPLVLAMGQSAGWTKPPFSGAREGRGNQQGSCCRWREGYFHTEKKKSQGKSSPAESLTALGVIADARGRGILEFAQVAERERALPTGGTWNQPRR